MVDAGEPSVELVNDPAFEPALRQALGQPSVLVIGEGGETRVSGYFSAIQSPLPIDVAFDVFWRVDGKEYRVGTLAFPTGDPQFPTPSYNGLIPPTTMTSADVVLRASADAARRTTNITRIWDGELVFPGVTLQRPPSRGRPP